MSGGGTEGETQFRFGENPTFLGCAKVLCSGKKRVLSKKRVKRKRWGVQLHLRLNPRLCYTKSGYWGNAFHQIQEVENGKKTRPFLLWMCLGEHGEASQPRERKKRPRVLVIRRKESRNAGRVLHKAKKGSLSRKPRKQRKSTPQEFRGKWPKERKKPKKSHPEQETEVGGGREVKPSMSRKKRTLFFLVSFPFPRERGA